jgi:hypothetical protein
VIRTAVIEGLEAHAVRRTALHAFFFTTALLAAPVHAQPIPPSRVGPADGLLVVTVDGKHGFIDLSGRMVIPPEFDFAWQFSEGLASAWRSGRAGFIDRTGAFVIAPRFEYARAFHEGLAEVQLGGLWGFVNRAGSLVIPPQFDDERWFSEGRAMVRIDGRWGFIDTSGALVIPARYPRQPTLFDHGRAIVQADGRTFAIDRNGEETARDPEELIPEQRLGKWGFVTPDGTVAVEFGFDGVQPFSEGLAAVQVGARWGFVDRRGRLVIPAEFEDGWASPPGGLRGGEPIGSFKEGLAAVYKDGAWRFIDKSGRAALPGRFAKVAGSGFRDGVVEVGGTTMGYIDRTGRTIWPWQ